ncbi:MAG: ORF6N domain-containing protein [Bacilli bacterium]|nr:ORF6N domain-containing protein [Bacilli bacterium]
MNNIEVTSVNIIGNLIYEVRGKQVMLASDLAKLYECKNGTKSINLAVSRNIDRFPSDFYFQLTSEEYNNLKFQIETSSLNNEHGGVRKLPYVFTEQGVAMLATVLKTEVASQMSISIMRAFVVMRKYVSQTLLEQKYINNQVVINTKNIRQLQRSLNKLEKEKKVNEIYFNGQIFDAYSKIYDIFKRAKKKLIVIDAYADVSLLNIIKKFNIDILIITRNNNLLTKQDIDKYNEQYHNLKIVFIDTFHDRYFILDDRECYHCGTSINRIGHKTFSINLIGDKDVCDNLINKVGQITKTND